MYVFNVQDALERFNGEVSLSDLATISSIINVPSPLVGLHPKSCLRLFRSTRLSFVNQGPPAIPDCPCAG